MSTQFSRFAIAALIAGLVADGRLIVRAGYVPYLLLALDPDGRLAR